MAEEIYQVIMRIDFTNLGKFSNNVDDLKSFITWFKTVTKTYKFPETSYAIEFSKCLTG